MTEERPLCTATKKDGSPCQGHALPGKTVCFSHVKTSDDQRKAQRARVAKQRRAKNPLYDHAEIAKDKLPLIYEALRAEIREPGWPVQPDWPVQLLALFLLITLAGACEEPATVYGKLSELIPDSLRPKPMPTMDELLRNARREWDRIRVQWSELTGLIPEPYPPHMLSEGMTQEQAQAEAREYLATIYSDVEDVPGLDTHVRAKQTATKQEILIRRSMNRPRSNVVGA